VQEPEGDALHNKTKKYFNDKNITIKQVEVIRKGSEIDYVLEIPTPVGSITYYCRAKSKKRCNDSDLASAFVQGQQKKLPVFFLANDLTKRAKEMLNSEFKNMLVKKMG